MLTRPDFHFPVLRPDRRGRVIRIHPFGSCRGVTLVEAMVSLTIFATVMLGFTTTFLQSRRLTESSVLHAAASSLAYGIIEQIKGHDYTTMLPNMEPDPYDPNVPSGQKAPYPNVRVRINQDKTVWLRPVYTVVTETVAAQGPTSTPPVGTTPTGAINNFIGNLPLSTVTGTTSQDLALNIWMWIDVLPPSGNASEVKKVTMVYTYSFMDGGKERVIRDREVFLRTRFDQ